MLMDCYDFALTANGVGIMKLARVLVALSAMLAFACGGDKDPPRLEVEGDAGGTGGGTGGQGGAGGIGGEGGSGGEGGTGGKEVLCGNGRLDEGEECDDGNRIEFDGCSPECLLEGTCENPIPWEAASVVEARQPHPKLVLREVQGNLRGHETQATACGHEGRQLVFEYVSEVDGRFYINFQNRGAPDQLIPQAFVTRSCDEGPLLCELKDPHTGLLSRFPVEKGDRFLLVVDSGEVDFVFKYFLSAGEIAYGEEGDACGRFHPESFFAFCAPDLYCNADEVCATNRSPVLHEAELFRHGPDGAHLTMRVVASDEDGHALRLWARFFDESGEELSEEPQLLGLFPHRESGEYVKRTVEFFGGGSAFADAVEAEVWMEDVVPGDPPMFTETEKFRIAFGDLPLRTESQTCDPERLRDACAPGLACEGEPATCVDLGPLRAPFCAEAAEVALDTDFDFVLESKDAIAPYFELPQACVEGWQKREAWFEGPLLTKLLRFSTAAALENVRFRFVEPGGRPRLDLGVMVLADCGAAEPLVCVDEVVATINPESDLYEEIVLPSLPAGDYLLVVRTVLPGIVVNAEDVVLRVTADP